MPKRPRRFRRPAADSFSPLRTLYQILALQAIYYFSATALILFTVLVAGEAFSVDLIFSWRSVRGDNTIGWTLGVVWLLCSLILVIAQLIIHHRSKLVLDFSLTLHGMHFLITSLYTHEVPRSWLWWGLQTTSASLMVGLATWACRWRELQPISFGGLGGSGVGEGGSSSRTTATTTIEDGVEYEMVQMKDGEV
ncbi:hypothetical protein RUND412_005849 [Rhizina undulata]